MRDKMKKVIVFCIIFAGLAFKGYATETETTDAESGYNTVIETILQDKTTDELEKIGLLQDKEGIIGPETIQAVINEHLTCADEKRSGERRCAPELLWLYSELLTLIRQ